MWGWGSKDGELPRSQGRSQGWWVGDTMVLGLGQGGLGQGGPGAGAGLGVRRQVEARRHSVVLAACSSVLPRGPESSWPKHGAEALGCVRTAGIAIP